VNQAQNEEIKGLTVASYEQNEQVKRISAWAAILFAPTLIASIYGMNFVNIPELDWGLGYPLALGLMVLVGGTLFLIFRRRGWL
jgi:magnesium transporter